MQLRMLSPVTLCAAGGLLLGLAAWLWTMPRHEAQTSFRAESSSTLERHETVFTRKSLAHLITRLDLYREARTRQPLEDVLETMRSDIRVESGDSTRLRFRYHDPRQAEAVVNELALMINGTPAPAATVDNVVHWASAWTPLAIGLGAGLAFGFLFQSGGRRMLACGLVGGALFYGAA